MENNKKKTKIMAVADLHGDSGLAKKLAKKAKKEEVDIVILAGDLTWLDAEVKDIVKPFQDAGKEILLIPGNHETSQTIDEMASAYKKTKNIHGYASQRNNLGIFGAGYDPSTGPFWINESELFKKLKKGHEKVKNLDKKIMVAHTLPKGSKAEVFGFSGSEALKKALKEFKPDVLISGHIHQAGGLQEKIGKTQVFHVGRKAKIFEI
jgi:uncharacterized protein